MDSCLSNAGATTTYATGDRLKSTKIIIDESQATVESVYLSINDIKFPLDSVGALIERCQNIPYNTRGRGC